MNRKSFVALALALSAFGPASAGTWTAPEGCEIFMTVQAKACYVANHYRCAGDAPGDQWRADFDQEGLFFRSRINSEAEWVESFDSNPPDRQWLLPGAPDPNSMTELLATSKDTFDFSLGRESGNVTRVTGYDRLTGRKVTIDGVELLETEFEFVEKDEFGNLYRAGRGNEYVHPEWRMFFSGPSEALVNDEWLPMDSRPMQFIFPGEKGFASTEPIFDCDPLTASLQQNEHPLKILQVSHGQ